MYRRTLILVNLMMLLAWSPLSTAQIECNDMHPFWSPHNNQIVFYRQCADLSNVFIFDFSAKSLSQITHDGNSFLPIWGKNSDVIIFRQHAGETDQLVSINLITDTQHVVRKGLDSKTLGAMSYSSQTDSVIFVDKFNDQKRIQQINLKNGNETTLLSGLEFAGNVAWSTKGLLFDYLENKQGVIALLSQNKEWQTIIDSPASEFYPQWNSSGDQIALISNQNGNFDTFIYDLTSNETQLMYGTEGFDGEATFSPDAKQLVFISIVDGRAALMIYDMQSKQVQQLLQ